MMDESVMIITIAATFNVREVEPIFTTGVMTGAEGLGVGDRLGQEEEDGLLWSFWLEMRKVMSNSTR